MNLIKFINKYQSILFLSCILVAMLVIKTTYRYDPSKDNLVTMAPTATPLPQPTVTIVPTPTEEIADKEYPLWNKLPYSGKGFVVDRYTAPLVLAVKIKGIDKKIVETEINKWLAENGVEGGSHKLEFE